MEIVELYGVPENQVKDFLLKTSGEDDDGRYIISVKIVGARIARPWSSLISRLGG
jgi:hypothetical protein